MTITPLETRAWDAYVAASAVRQAAWDAYQDAKKWADAYATTVARRLADVGVESAQDALGGWLQADSKSEELHRAYELARRVENARRDVWIGERDRPEHPDGSRGICNGCEAPVTMFDAVWHHDHYDPASPCYPTSVREVTR